MASRQRAERAKVSKKRSMVIELTWRATPCRCVFDSSAMTRHPARKDTTGCVELDLIALGGAFDAKQWAALVKVE